MPITTELKLITEGRQTLSLHHARALMQRLLTGEASETELAALLAALAARGETAEEIAGFALAMREAAITLPLAPEEREQLVDTCGTGGDGANTFNISTAAALVAAAAGAKVAKHGNRAITSKCGSADVLEALGIPIDLSPQAGADALRTHNFCFMLAPGHHPGMRAVLPVRRALGIRTIFNVLGPLLNPAGAQRQVMGVYSETMLRPVAEAMPHLGVRRAMVVHGHSGLDELSTSGPTRLVWVSQEEGAPRITEQQILPETAGLPQSPLDALAAGSNAAENAQILRNIFAGERSARRDAVLLNAAAVLVVAERAPDLKQAAALAAETIDAGAVTRLVQRLSR